MGVGLKCSVEGRLGPVGEVAPDPSSTHATEASPRMRSAPGILEVIRELGLCDVRRSKTVITTTPGETNPRPANLVERDFAATRPPASFG